MLLGAHLILSAYGFWLPNDPRGSWSDFVASWELLLYGKATKVSTTRSVASVPHDRALRKAAKKALIHPQVFFDGTQALTIARGFARAAREVDLPVHACSILPTRISSWALIALPITCWRGALNPLQPDHCGSRALIL